MQWKWKSNELAPEGEGQTHFLSAIPKNIVKVATQSQLKWLLIQNTRNGKWINCNGRKVCYLCASNIIRVSPESWFLVVHSLGKYLPHFGYS